MEKPLSSAAGLAGLAVFSIWVGVAVWMILTVQPGRVWWAWGVSVLFVLLIPAIIGQIQARGKTTTIIEKENE